MTEPLFSCQVESCREEVSYPASCLRTLIDKPICQDCYDNCFELQIPKTFDEEGDPDEVVWWRELPPFVPDHEKRIADLEAENKRQAEWIAGKSQHIGRLATQIAMRDEWIAEAKQVLWAHEKSDHALPYELQNLRDALLEGSDGNH